MTKEVTRKPKPKPGEGVSRLEALSSAPERSMDRLEAVEKTEAHIGLPPQPQQRQFNPNLMAAAPGSRDHRFDGLHGEDRISAAVEIGALSNIGGEMGLDDDTTLGEVERLRMSGADGISGMEDNPEVRKDTDHVSDREWYDGHRLHVLRNIGEFCGQPILVDFTTLGDNDEEFNASFFHSVDTELLPRLYKAVKTSEAEHSGRDAEKLFRSWRTLGGSFDLDSVGEISRVRARSGVNMTQLFVIAFLGGLGALCFLIAALYIFGPYLPPLTN